jgi:dihydroorotase
LIARDALLAEYEDGRIHVQHVSCVQSIEAVAAAKARGVRITTEVTPHHLTLTDEAIGDGTDANFKMNPPLRTEEDRQALIEALRSGVIDIIATDHAPHAAHEKDVPFEEAPFGVTGLETAFAALNTHLVEPGLLTLPTLLERMSAGPARAYGLDTPRIARGVPANLVLLDPGTAWRVGEDGFRSRSANSWLLGETLRGKVRMTVAAGRIAYEAA